MYDRHDIGISIDSDDERAGAAGDAMMLADGAAAGAEKSPRIFIYDSYPGGIGFSEPLFRMHDDLLDGTRRLISEFPCERGCPGCVGPIGNTGPLAKSAALRILGLLHHAPV